MTHTLSQPAVSLTQPDRSRRELTGTVNMILFTDPSSNIFIGKLRNGTIVKGTADRDSLEIGETYRFFGRWTDHPTRGPQFAFETWTIDTPVDQAGLQKYLAKYAPHVGEVRAQKLIDAFGSEAMNVLIHNPLDVSKLGIMPLAEAAEAAEALAASAKESKTKIDLMGLFGNHGFGGRAVAACIKKWGARAAVIIRRDPFKLLTAEIPGAGFRRCDKLYLEQGGNPLRLKRQMLAAWEELRTNNDGHTWHVAATVKRSVILLVGREHARPEAALKLGVRAGKFTLRADMNTTSLSLTGYVAEALKAANEMTVARSVALLMLHEAPVIWPSRNELTNSGMSDHQLDLTDIPLRSKVCILAGTPGTGKTFTAARILQQCVARLGPAQICVMAPTGKAAVRITEAMRRYGVPLTATTIHRALMITRNGHDGKGWGFEFNEHNPMPYKVICVDETSMLDTDLAASVFRACAPGCHVLLVGDPYQLAPVGHGAPFRDLIAAGVPSCELTEIKRNDGLIVRACASIKNGKSIEAHDKYLPEEQPAKNLRFIEVETEEEQLDALQQIILGAKAGTRFDPVWGTQVLCARNENSRISRTEVNRILQGMLNPDMSDRPEDGSGPPPVGHEFRVDDKLICLRNVILPLFEWNGLGPVAGVDSYTSVRDQACFLANGEIGRVTAVAPKALIATFDEPARVVRIPIGGKKSEEAGDTGEKAGGATDFALAYAITTHKSQGSEWPLVIVLVDPGAGFVASREFHYTAISRASKLCVLIGRRDIFERQCRKLSLQTRRTHLKELLRRELIKGVEL